MDVEAYLAEKREMQKKILDIINNDHEFDLQANIQDLLHYFQNNHFFENRHEFKIILTLILKICNNHHRTPTFFNRFEQILLMIKDEIKQAFSNDEIFQIFKSNKRILLFLFKSQILIPNDSIIEIITSKKFRRKNYLIYLFSELKSILNDELLIQTKEQINKALNIDVDVDEELFIQKVIKGQLEGENNNYICELIRNDSIDEFIVNHTKNNFSLSSTISPSIFETNNFLLKNRPSLIEYAAFYGSIQIFQYLFMNGIELKPSLWLYTIHGGNAELIHHLENNHVKPPNNSYQECLNEALKCHNFEIIEYIINNLIENENNECFSMSVKYFNFCYFPSNLTLPVSFYYLCKYGYFDLVKHTIESNDLKEETIRYEKNNLITPLQIAVEKENKEIVQLLMNNLHFCKKAFIKKAFFNCCSLKEIEIPSFLTELGDSTFNGCTSLKKVIIPSSITKIGSYVFNNCSSLEELIIPQSVTEIGNGSFCNCCSLKQLVIPSTLKEIKESTFAQCSSLESFIIPSSVTNIDDSAFADCSSLKEIEIPSSIKEIKDKTFMECSSLTFISIPSSVTSILNFAFSNCTALVKIDLPSSISFIGDGAFNECSSLLQISIPENVTEISSSVFYNCSSLVKVSFQSEIESIGSYSFSGCSSLVEIKIPSSLKLIDEYAFNCCSSLKEIEIRSSMTKIGKYAFQDCSSLEKVEISSSIQIDQSVFKGCTLLNH